MQFSWGKEKSFSVPSRPRLVITAEDEDFDSSILARWREEGFDVSYLPYLGNAKQYAQQIHHLADPLGLSEKYAIIG